MNIKEIITDQDSFKQFFGVRQQGDAYTVTANVPIFDLMQTLLSIPPGVPLTVDQINMMIHEIQTSELSTFIIEAMAQAENLAGPPPSLAEQNSIAVPASSNPRPHAPVNIAEQVELAQPESIAVADAALANIEEQPDYAAEPDRLLLIRGKVKYLFDTWAKHQPEFGATTVTQGIFKKKTIVPAAGSIISDVDIVTDYDRPKECVCKFRFTDEAKAKAFAAKFNQDTSNWDARSKRMRQTIIVGNVALNRALTTGNKAKFFSQNKLETTDVYKEIKNAFAEQYAQVVVPSYDLPKPTLKLDDETLYSIRASIEYFLSEIDEYVNDEETPSAIRDNYLTQFTEALNHVVGQNLSEQAQGDAVRLLQASSPQLLTCFQHIRGPIARLKNYAVDGHQKTEPERTAENESALYFIRLLISHYRDRSLPTLRSEQSLDFSDVFKLAKDEYDRAFELAPRLDRGNRPEDYRAPAAISRFKEDELIDQIEQDLNIKFERTSSSKLSYGAVFMNTPTPASKRFARLESICQKQKIPFKHNNLPGGMNGQLVSITIDKKDLGSLYEALKAPSEPNMRRPW